MAKYYGTLEGARGHVTRCGTSGSGIEAHISGWNHGIRVHVGDAPNGEVVVSVSVTCGSNSPGCISSIMLTEDVMESLGRGESELQVVPIISDYYTLKEEGDSFDLGTDIDVDSKIQ